MYNDDSIMYDMMGVEPPKPPKWMWWLVGGGAVWLMLAGFGVFDELFDDKEPQKPQEQLDKNAQSMTQPWQSRPQDQAGEAVAKPHAFVLRHSDN